MDGARDFNGKNINGWVVVVREKKELFSVKTRLERSIRWPWLATAVQPRRITFALVDAWVQALDKDVEHLFVSPKKHKVLPLINK